MDIYITIVGFFQSGGIFMYPIVLILALGLAIALERWLYLSKARITNQLVWRKLQPLLQNGDHQQAAHAALAQCHGRNWPRRRAIR